MTDNRVQVCVTVKDHEVSFDDGANVISMFMQSKDTVSVLGNIGIDECAMNTARVTGGKITKIMSDDAWDKALRR